MSKLTVYMINVKNLRFPREMSIFHYSATYFLIYVRFCKNKIQFLMKLSKFKIFPLEMSKILLSF